MLVDETTNICYSVHNLLENKLCRGLNPKSEIAKFLWQNNMLKAAMILEPEYSISRITVSEHVPSFLSKTSFVQNYSCLKEVKLVLFKYISYLAVHSKKSFKNVRFQVATLPIMKTYLFWFDYEK